MTAEAGQQVSEWNPLYGRLSRERDHLRAMLAAVTAERDQALEALAATNKLGAFETGKTIGAAEVRKELDQARQMLADAWRQGVGTALNHAIRNQDGITLRLEHLDGTPWKNPYQDSAAVSLAAVTSEQAQTRHVLECAPHGRDCLSFYDETTRPGTRHRCTCWKAGR